MTEPGDLAIAFAQGILLGMFFYAGLWWTVLKIVSSKNVALWFLSSLLLRTSIVLLGFYFVMGDNWQKLVAGLFGFTLARILVTRLTRTAKQPNPLAQRIGHAP